MIIKKGEERGQMTTSSSTGGDNDHAKKMLPLGIILLKKQCWELKAIVWD